MKQQEQILMPRASLETLLNWAHDAIDWRDESDADAAAAFNVLDQQLENQSK